MSGSEPAWNLDIDVTGDDPPARPPSTRTPPDRAGLGTSLGFFLVPPAAGVALGGVLLTQPADVPWVLGGSLLVALVAFLLVAPLGRRSKDFQNATYRRSTELAVLAGLTACALIAYTLIVYLMLGVRSAWLLETALALTGG
jgi:hypothetical protein